MDWIPAIVVGLTVVTIMVLVEKWFIKVLLTFCIDTREETKKELEELYGETVTEEDLDEAILFVIETGKNYFRVGMAILTIVVLMIIIAVTIP